MPTTRFRSSLLQEAALLHLKALPAVPGKNQPFSHVCAVFLPPASFASPIPVGAFRIRNVSLPIDRLSCRHLKNKTRCLSCCFFSHGNATVTPPIVTHLKLPARVLLYQGTFTKYNRSQVQWLAVRLVLIFKRTKVKAGTFFVPAFWSCRWK